MRKLVLLWLIIMLVGAFSLVGYASSELNINSNEIKNKIEIISPATNTIYSDYLLISIKILDNKSIKLTLFAHDKVNNTENINIYPITSSSAIKIIKNEDNESMEHYKYLYGETINTTGDFTYYTVQLENMQPGAYKMSIEDLDDEGKVTRTIYKEFEIKNKSDQPKEVINTDKFIEMPSNKLQVLQDIIKSIFRN